MYMYTYRVGIRAQQEEVAALLHGGEAVARHNDGAGASEALNGSAHSGLELEHGGRRLVLGAAKDGVLNKIFIKITSFRF